MGVALAVRNTSRITGSYSIAALKKLAARVCDGEGVPGDVEVSVLFCGDKAIRKLNKQYAGKDEATDVLSFEQSGAFPTGTARHLGDIVVSLETVRERCGGKVRAMREEVQLLFCHGLLHLLGYDHADAKARDIMVGKQAKYLGCTRDAAWFSGH